MVFCFNMTIDSSNAIELVSQFDLVVDCTDNVATRYLLNDACFLAKPGGPSEDQVPSRTLRVPLVSGAALRWDGQVTVYANDGPCYRCVHPKVFYKTIFFRRNQPIRRHQIKILNFATNQA